ncbi:hypothetical protein CDIK_0965 [Cucumispora dikerogammari]|nr:hypothetical protein CDIK_0965 [Cucumispora dikerogammari]
MQTTITSITPTPITYNNTNNKIIPIPPNILTSKIIKYYNKEFQKIKLFKTKNLHFLIYTPDRYLLSIIKESKEINQNKIINLDYNISNNSISNNKKIYKILNNKKNSNNINNKNTIFISISTQSISSLEKRNRSRFNFNLVYFPPINKNVYLSFNGKEVDFNFDTSVFWLFKRNYELKYFTYFVITNYNSNNNNIKAENSQYQPGPSIISNTIISNTIISNTITNNNNISNNNKDYNEDISHPSPQAVTNNTTSINNILLPIHYIIISSYIKNNYKLNNLIQNIKQKLSFIKQLSKYDFSIQYINKRLSEVKSFGYFNNISGKELINSFLNDNLFISGGIQLPVYIKELFFYFFSFYIILYIYIKWTRYLYMC